MVKCRTYFWVLATLVIGQLVVAQNSIDTFYKTTYYEQKLTLFRLLPDTKDEIIFLGNSITDISKEVPDSMILANHKTICQRIKAVSSETKIYVQSHLPTNNAFTEFKRYQNQDEYIRNVNAGLQKLCVQMGLTYIDLYSRFLDKDGKLDKQYTNDGLHINGYGYLLWKRILKEKGAMH